MSYASLRWQLAQKIEKLWWANYLKKKDKTTYLEWKKNYWKGIIDKAGPSLAKLEGKSILDAGCGPAGIFIILNNSVVDAADPLLNEYEKTLSVFTKSDYPYVSFYNSSLEDFESKKRYDVVFCMNAINHVHDIEACFAKLGDLTEKNGLLLISIDSHNFQLLKSIFRLIPGDVLHPHQYDLNEYQESLTKKGFKLLSTELIKSENIFSHYMILAQKL